VRQTAAAALALLAVAVLAADCSGRGEPKAVGAQPARITVLAAASLTDVFPRIDPHPRYSFAGSDELALQIRQGAPADVFAAASPKFPDELHAKRLVGKPVVFARNRLVLIAPASNPAHVHSLRDLRRPGIKLVVAAPEVPVGSYTRDVLRKLRLSSVLSHVVSNEPDVRAVLTKVVLGEADAGFVYVTDTAAASGKLTVIPVPARAQPEQAYEVAVVTGSSHRAAARAFVRELLSPRAQRLLRAARFLPPR
jgi:molybdate transport system substrate-binding protein